MMLLSNESAFASSPQVSFSGAGWGDGVGLSQYGAKAMGADGVSEEEIISRYFKNVNVTNLGSVSSDTFLATDFKPLWIGLIQKSSTVSFFLETGSARLCFDATEDCFRTINPGTTYQFALTGSGECVFMQKSLNNAFNVLGVPGLCSASVRPNSPDTQIKIPFKARSYRNGNLRFRKGTSDPVINTVFQTDQETYLKGIFEIPDSWSTETLKAQAIVSRSRALRSALDRGGEGSLKNEWRERCYCNILDGQGDPVFLGWTGEDAHKNWVNAVQETSRKVISYKNKIALGLHTSSSGGFTESYFDVYGVNEHPYMVSVKDSPAFSDLADNPHAYWTAGYSLASLADSFDFQWLSNLEVIERNVSGSAKTIRITGIVDGFSNEINVSSVDFRSALSLRSTTFDISLSPIFEDVPTGHIFGGEVQGMFDSGITSGCKEKYFCPNSYLTRAEMAAFLVRALELQISEDNQVFVDDNGHFLEKEFATLHKNGITQGCTERNFCPEQRVTRAEMAAFLVRALKLPSSEPQVSFNDIEGNFFQSEIKSLAASGITQGCSEETFCPDELVTRGEMAAFLIRGIYG